jgi:phosphoserine aminotransferase
VVNAIADLLESEAVAFDVAGHRNAPPGLRIWCGTTVETAEIEELGPWLDWAWEKVKG